MRQCSLWPSLGHVSAQEPQRGSRDSSSEENQRALTKEESGYGADKNNGHLPFRSWFTSAQREGMLRTQSHGLVIFPLDQKHLCMRKEISEVYALPFNDLQSFTFLLSTRENSPLLYILGSLFWRAVRY